MKNEKFIRYFEDNPMEIREFLDIHDKFPWYFKFYIYLRAKMRI
jgi:hypothetical protein